MKNNILKSIFVTILLLLGVSHAANASDWAEGKTLYFDNSFTQWSEVYVIIGHGGYSRAYKMDAVANTTLYKYTMSPKWGGYDQFVIASSIGGSNLNGNNTAIGTAYGSCESRISSVSDNISADVLIKVTGTTSPYSQDILTSFDLNDYSTTNKLPSANGEVSNLIIFNTSTATKSAWLWKKSGSDTLHNTTVSGTANSSTLSFYNNAGKNYNQAIGFVEAGNEGSTSFPNFTSSTKGSDIDGSSCTSNNLYYLEGADKFVDFVHLGATFEVSSTSPSTNTTITLTATPNANATLYKDAGNSAKYAFYVKDAESNITCLSSFSTTNSISYTTPSTAQTITLYCYVRDLYGLETIQYSREISVSSSTSCTSPTIAWGTAPADGTVGGNMTATVSTNQTSPTITWNSSNTSVATVDNNGKITYKAAGTTTITASYTGDGTTYCAEEASVSQTITVTAAATALNIYVQGRFKVRTAKGGSNWLYTGDANGSWNTSSKSIKFEYEEATGYYKLNTYCSVAEYSEKAPNNEGYYFHFTEGSTEYGATVDNVKPALESNKRDIQSGSKNFIFTETDCPKGDNVVLYLDWVNKKFWYAVDPSSTYTVTITAGEGGSVSPSGAQQVGSTPVTIKATPNTGYVFDKWTVTGGATVASTTSATTTVTATATGTVTANFKASSTSVSYYYHDDKNTKWTGDGQVGTANSTEGYVYWEFSKNQYDDNNFKIFNCKPKPTDEQEGQIHPNLIGYDDKIDNTLSNGGLTLTDPSGDNWHNIRLPNTSGAYYIILYLPNSTYNTTSEYKVAIRVTLPGTTAATSYWYFDDDNTQWSEETPIADKWKFVDAGNYAYVLVPANNESNKFKVFSCNPKNDSKLVANDGNIATGELAGDIALKNTDTDWHNIVIDAVPSDYYVLLYYPNTSTNSSSKYLVAATYDLPGVQKYAVSFGVVGNSGGSITAKSGSSTITSGQLVSRATFTATPAAGYSVEGWYADAEGTQKITAAGTNTTYTQAITEANNTVYVKFAKVYAIYYKFNDQKWDDNYYAYIFTNEVWHSENGVQPKVNRSEYGKMSKYNDSVYYYKFTKSADYPRFAFSWGDHSNDDYFYNIDAVYRGDFHKDMPVFIAEKGQSADTKNQTKYYKKGVWMKFNDTDPGYNLCLTTDNGNTWNESYRFTAAKAGDYISTVNVVLTKGVPYKFWVKNDKSYYFKTEAGTCTSVNHKFTFYVYDSGGSPITITPAITGTYTFQLNLANGKVEIDVLYPTTSYRLVYVEKNGSTIEKFHPSHIIKSHPDATAEAPMFDTVSMHVRLKLLQKKTVSGTTDVKYDTLANENTCEVWLQEFKEDGGTMDWATIKTIDTKTYLTTNGVYNFIITQAAGTATIEPTAIRPYTGRYYIRTDASNGGWNNYKQLSNYCYYTEYSRVYRGFDYYFCRWAPKANIKYTIACDYSYCVSDTLAQEDHAPHSTYTDANGTLQHDANVRFMWHSFSNELDRAYIAGAGDNLYLMSEAGIYNMEGNQKTSAKLEDQQNWVYRVDVKADTKARIKLRAVPYNSATTYSWFRGLDGDFSNENTEQLIEGKSDTQYTIRVIYDFKTDHLICAWIPDKDTITSDDVINADLMIIRTDQGEAAQLNFKPNETKVTNITVAYCVLNLTKDHLSSNTKSSKERSCYWVSFPFDVNLSDVFGCGKYGEDFIIQYYDGAERAQKGCWIDSPTYWKYITNPTGVVLKKGMGYVLVIDYEKILNEQFKHSNSSVNIYFPSSGPIDAIDGVLPTAVEVPEHKCTITRNDRYIYDSNWNIIGVPTWANIDEFGNPMVAEQSTSALSQGGTVTYTIGFYYAHDAKNNKWTVCETSKVDFLSMYSYLVQWAGTINWQEKSATGKHHPSSLAPRRYAPAAEGEATAPEQYTLCLTLHRGETQLDHTYIRLQEGNVTTDFDLNYDMTKILNNGANLYSLVGTNLIQCAANVQPLQEEAQTISIPLGVVADQDGLYTFSLPEGTEGMNVSIADSESGTVHNLALGDYQTALTKDTYEGRFALEIQPRQEVSTGCEQTDAAGKHLRKVLIDGNLYILRDGKAYTAAGQEL